MRNISAIAAFLLGLLLLGLGIGQLLSSADAEDIQTQSVPEAPFTMITDELTDSEAEREEFLIQGEGEYTLAIGRSYDVEAWLGDAAHNRVGGVVSGGTEGSDASEHIAVEHIEGESEAPNPENSDLWVQTEDVSDDLLYRWNAPENDDDWALLVFVDGEQPAPVSISVEPEEDAGINGAAVALLVIGAVSLLVGVVLFSRTLAARRRTRAAGAAAAGVVAVAAVSAVLLSQSAVPAQAQSEDDADEDAAEETDSAEGDSEAEESENQEESEEQPEGEDTVQEAPEEGYSVLLASQLDRILEAVAEEAAAADEEQDAELLGDRVAGHAAQVRELSYRNQGLTEEGESPAAIGTEVLSAVVTSENEFPRSVTAITEDPESDTPQVLVLEQTAPRENYQLTHFSYMAPGTEFPSFSAEQGGVTNADTGEESELRELFGQIAEGVVSADADISDRLAESNYLDELHGYFEDLEEEVLDTELNLPTPSVGEDLTALELPDGNTLLSGSFEQVIQMAPLEDGDTIFLEHGLIEELTETDWTTFPTEITTLQTLTVVIPADEESEIVLLGVNDIVSDASIDTPEWFEGYDE